MIDDDLISYHSKKLKSFNRFRFRINSRWLVMTTVVKNELSRVSFRHAFVKVLFIIIYYLFQIFMSFCSINAENNLVLSSILFSTSLVQSGLGPVEPRDLSVSGRPSPSVYTSVVDRALTFYKVQTHAARIAISVIRSSNPSPHTSSGTITAPRSLR